MITDTVIHEEEHSRQGGFTLVELLIVIVILGILTAVVVFSVGGLRQSGNRAACVSQVRTLEIGLEAFNSRTGSYPGWNATAGLPGTITATDAVTATNPILTHTALSNEQAADVIAHLLVDQDAPAGAGSPSAATGIKLLKSPITTASHGSALVAVGGAVLAPAVLPSAVPAAATIPIPSANYDGAFVTLVYRPAQFLYGTPGAGTKSASMDVFGWYSDGGQGRPCIP